MDNIKDAIPLAAVSSAERVKTIDHRENSNRNNLFKEPFKKKKKKKKKDELRINISTKATLVGHTHSIRQSAAKKKAKGARQKKTIDIVI
ncbi:MAG: hypothetical protein PVH85_12520 [Desulfobacterales bacterium]|jgi:hypothetical protein